MKITDKVFEIVADAHDVPLSTLTLQTHFYLDLDDSIGVLDDIMSCKQDFDIKISHADAEEIETIADLIRCVETKLKQKPPEKPVAARRTRARFFRW